MDIIREILEVLDGQTEAITMRHIVYRTGFAPSTLVGVMMGMINQGYVTDVLPVKGQDTSGFSRCTCACCSRETDRESTTSMDRRTYRISLKGKIYLKNWAKVPK